MMKEVLTFEQFIQINEDAQLSQEQQSLINKLKPEQKALIDKLKPQLASCYSAKKYPNLHRITLGSSWAILSLIFTAASILTSEVGGAMILSPFAIGFGFKTFDELDKVDQAKVTPELKALFKCLGSDISKLYA